MENTSDPRQLPFDSEIEMVCLVERIAHAIADRMIPPVPVSSQLWNGRLIGAYLQRSPAVVLERIVTLPGFPAPIRLPSTRAKPKDEIESPKLTTGQPLWKATEVIRWAESHQHKHVGRPRKS